MELGEADANQRRRVAVGEEVTLRLAENPSTGFRWSEPDYDPNVLQYSSSEYEIGGTRPGAAGVRVVRLRAIAPGASWVRLRSGRPTVPGSPGERQYEVTIEVT
jgi:inhibitor of cysteine peptidase